MVRTFRLVSLDNIYDITLFNLIMPTNESYTWYICVNMFCVRFRAYPLLFKYVRWHYDISPSISLHLERVIKYLYFCLNEAWIIKLEFTYLIAYRFSLHLWLYRNVASTFFFGIRTWTQNDNWNIIYGQ